MKWCILLLALLQFQGCLCFPAPNMSSMPDKCLEASMSEFNTRHAVTNLYWATRAIVKRVFPVGQNTFDLLMKFDAKETQCLKGSGQDAKTCKFNTSPFALSSRCSSRVRLSSTGTQVVTLICAQDSSSSSSESSEEVNSRGQQHYRVSGLNQV